jgi:Domain of unknown function DUF29
VSNSLYDRDFYAWANQQAALLRAGRVTEADIQNIAEEIESMGRSERRELVNCLAVLLQHLLKWQYQPLFRGASWRLTVEEQRYRLKDPPERQSQLAIAASGDGPGSLPAGCGPGPAGDRLRADNVPRRFAPTPSNRP